MNLAKPRFSPATVPTARASVVAGEEGRYDRSSGTGDRIGWEREREREQEQEQELPRCRVSGAATIRRVAVAATTLDRYVNYCLILHWKEELYRGESATTPSSSLRITKLKSPGLRSRCQSCHRRGRNQTQSLHTAKIQPMTMLYCTKQPMTMLYCKNTTNDTAVLLF